MLGVRVLTAWGGFMVAEMGSWLLEVGHRHESWGGGWPWMLVGAMATGPVAARGGVMATRVGHGFWDGRWSCCWGWVYGC